MRRMPRSVVFHALSTLPGMSLSKKLLILQRLASLLGLEPGLRFHGLMPRTAGIGRTSVQARSAGQHNPRACPWTWAKRHSSHPIGIDAQPAHELAAIRYPRSSASSARLETSTALRPRVPEPTGKPGHANGCGQ